MPGKIDSNLTGLRFAEEVYGTPGTLAGTEVWLPLEPNSYAEFGGQVSQTARMPITRTRQRKKGMVTDLDATAGFQSDFLQESLYSLMQGFFFADWREKFSNAPIDGTGWPILSVSGTTDGYIAADSFTSFPLVHSLLFAEGFTETANNGLKVVTVLGGDDNVNVAEQLTTEASPPTTATIREVGYQFEVATLNVDFVDPVVHLNRASGAVDFTTLGLIPGEWIFLGGDSATLRFANNQGFARVLSVTAAQIVLDKFNWTPVDETGTGKTVQMFFGSVIRSEDDPDLIKHRTYQMERYTGDASVGYQYVLGCSANTMEVKVTTADKVTVDFGFVGIDEEFEVSAKAGTRPDIPDEPAFNTSSDFSRLRMLNTDTDLSVFTYLTEMSISINNGIVPSKSIAVLGAFDTTAGDFVVEGSVTAYFTSAAAAAAVRANANVSLDFAMVKENAGWVFDIPQISLGDGRAQVEKDTEIKLPLTIAAAQDPVLNHTMLAVCFFYLPTLAD